MNKSIQKNWFCTLASIVLMLGLTQITAGYSVFAHKAIIDSVWTTTLSPLLVKRYPTLTEKQLQEAHAYAYGGSIIQDLGYYPFSNKFFSDLTHYTRSGDFIAALLSESHDANEFAFALGALSHYASDNNGHSICTNYAVAIYNPDLRRKHGTVVTYAESPNAHRKAEFGFDVVQVARGNYAPQSYQEFIGFKVSQPLLERAFLLTYGLELNRVLADTELAIGTFRWSVSQVIPYMTKVAWETKKDEISQLKPGITRNQFQYSYKRKQFEKEFGTRYKRPSFIQRTLGLGLRFIPKVGPFRMFAFQTTTTQTEALFQESFNQTVIEYKRLIASSVEGGRPLSNTDLDTGKDTHPGEYKLTDETYGKLIVRLNQQKFKNVTPEIKSCLLDFYKNPESANAVKAKKGKWREIATALDNLKPFSPIEPEKLLVEKETSRQ